jgi:hypothetical protein
MNILTVSMPRKMKEKKIVECNEKIKLDTGFFKGIEGKRHFRNIKRG